MNKQFCENCGNELPTGTKFCDNCGFILEGKDNKTNHQELNQKINLNKHLKDIKNIILNIKKNKTILLVIFLLIVLGCLLLFFRFIPTNHTAIQSTNQSGEKNIYYLSHGDFSVYFPLLPGYMTETSELTKGNKVLWDRYVFAINPPESSASNNEQNKIISFITADHISSPFSKSGLTPEENLAQELSYTSGENSGDSKIIYSVATTFDGFPAIKYKVFYSSQNYYQVGIDILKNSDLYILDYIYAPEQENKQLEDEFLNSLQFGKIKNSMDVSGRIFYLQSTAKVRSCASISCDPPIGTYPINTGFPLNYASANNLPDWVQISWLDNNGKIANGYIGKAILGENEVAVQSSTQSNSQPQKPKTLPGIIAEWSPHVALVLCKYSDGSSAFGSGYLNQFTDGTINILTNKHVITDDYGYIATSCSVEIPGDGDSYYTEYSDNLKTGDVGDWGFIVVADGSTYFNNIAKSNLQVCQQQEQTGDSIVVLGYPDYAGQFTQPTATQGIISGYAPPYYTTSAQIESGNSGGTAIDTNKDCYVGIPTAVKIGDYANLGRILNANVPFKLPY